MDHPLEKLVAGTVIDLAGQVLGNRNRFHIHLETGTGEIALHVNPRFDEGEVVFNTLRNGRWEREERVGRLPVQQGCSFEAMILVEEMGYKVAFNKCHFADFKHRLQYSMVKRLKVDGCVTIRRFEQKQPQEPSPSTVLPVLPSPMLPVLSSPFPPVQTTPLLGMLPGGHLAPGLTVQLSGRPHSDAKLFWTPASMWPSMGSPTCGTSTGCSHCSASATSASTAMCCCRLASSSTYK
ncbi:galectin-4-like isoform X2 [Amblyomma americanum]